MTLNREAFLSYNQKMNTLDKKFEHVDIMPFVHQARHYQQASYTALEAILGCYTDQYKQCQAVRE